MSSILERLEAPFRAGFSASRSILLRRGLYLLLALDAWLVMVEHGGRYGAGGFNVAHFAWIDALVGVPSPSLYVGLLIGVGLASLSMAIGPMRGRTARLLLFVVYTASWLISLHDSYQHHYLLSWLLLWSAFLPEEPEPKALLSASQARKQEAPCLTLSAYTCAIVYAFTAISKSSLEWRSGEVLERLTHSQPAGAKSPGKLDFLRDSWVQLTGASNQEVFAYLSLGLVALQCVIVAGYLAAPGRDQLGTADERRSVRSVLCSLALLGSVCFHVGAEFSGVLRIGWFSYYMLWVALCLLSPDALTSGVLRTILRGIEWGSTRLSFGWRPAFLGLFGGGLLVLCSVILDLPGAAAACAAFGLFTLGGLGGSGLGSHASRGAEGRARRLLVAASIATCALWASLGLGEVRFDFYRRWAGEVQRLGQRELALALYKKAERYAPEGQSRARQIQELERKLSASPPTQPGAP